MILWRISRHRGLKGLGGLKESGRWHDRPRAIVYLAESPAAALLEVFVHLEIESVDDLPDAYRLLEIHVPAAVRLKPLPARSLPRRWQRSETMTRPSGNRWFDAGRHALLRVPSALVPASFNVILNPGHRDARQIRVARAYPAPFDPRLVKGS